ncbi:unnamed protein product [Trichogramma brassicae]|uniref:Odorant receptor n=1 Tax=Trichogramma brassicae TaxID=86971 RepID=A0A6H5J271_9HYME|nr:unnamed protein product [Trichogramma brassicae]
MGRLPLPSLYILFFTHLKYKRERLGGIALEALSLIDKSTVHLRSSCAIIKLQCSRVRSELSSSKLFKSIYAKIADHWSMIDDAEELEIVSKNMEQGYGVVKIYSLYCIIGMGCFLAMPITYPLLDYVIPMENKTRTMGEPAYVEYGLDPEKYYYPLMIQGFFGGLGCISVFVAFDASYMMLTNYVIGLFALAK